MSEDEKVDGHTTEPWNLYGPFEDGYVGVSSGETQPGKRRMLARTDSPNVHGDLSQTERDANARRIVACVNACQGIETESLEKGANGWLAKVIVLGGDATAAADACGALLIETISHIYGDAVRLEEQSAFQDSADAIRLAHKIEAVIAKSLHDRAKL